MKTKYLEFIEDNKWSLSHKTRRFIIKNRTQDMIIGQIKFNSHWRQYCFYPENETVWSVGCLNDVISFIEQLKY